MGSMNALDRAVDHGLDPDAPGQVREQRPGLPIGDGRRAAPARGDFRRCPCCGGYRYRVAVVVVVVVASETAIAPLDVLPEGARRHGLRNGGGHATAAPCAVVVAVVAAAAAIAAAIAPRLSEEDEPPLGPLRQAGPRHGVLQQVLAPIAVAVRHPLGAGPANAGSRRRRRRRRRSTRSPRFREERPSSNSNKVGRRKLPVLAKVAAAAVALSPGEGRGGGERRPRRYSGAVRFDGWRWRRRRQRRRQSRRSRADAAAPAGASILCRELLFVAVVPEMPATFHRRGAVIVIKAQGLVIKGPWQGTERAARPRRMRVNRRTRKGTRTAAAVFVVVVAVALPTRRHRRRTVLPRP
jgi:hypothetical protein